MSNKQSGEERAPPGPALDLSHKYLKSADVNKLTQGHALCTVSQPEYKGLNLSNSVLVDEVMEMSRDIQGLLMSLSNSLVWVNMSKSNASGRVFYKGIQVQVKDAMRDNVQIIDEKAVSYNSMDTFIKLNDEDGNEEPKAPIHPTIKVDKHPIVVRDDDPPRLHTDEETKQKFYYVRTEYDTDKALFFRYYVRLDWLARVVELDLSSTSISGYGMTSMVAATAKRLQSLRVSRCERIDDRGLYAVTNLCSSLRHLDISYCKNVTPFGVIYLSELPHEQVQRLHLINLAGCSKLTNRVATGLLNALCEKDFPGFLRYPEQDPKTREYETKKGSPNRPKISTMYENNSRRIIDLTGADLTSFLLHRYKNDNSQYSLDLSGCLINDMILGKILASFGTQLRQLCLDSSYITLNGLSHLINCPYLEILSLSKCWNILYKSDANRKIMPAMSLMNNLKQLDISDSRLSGRILSTNPKMKLTHLNAARSPISVHAVRLLTETCKDSLLELSLKGCSFIDNKSMSFISRFTNLQKLDLSDCVSLSAIELETLKRSTPSFFHTLKEINVTNIRGMDENTCQYYANHLSSISENAIVVGTISSEISIFRGETPDVSHPYSQLNPSEMFNKRKNTPPRTPGQSRRIVSMDAKINTPTQKKSPILSPRSTTPSFVTDTNPLSSMPHSNSYESISTSDFQQLATSFTCISPTSLSSSSSSNNNNNNININTNMNNMMMESTNDITPTSVSTPTTTNNNNNNEMNNTPITPGIDSYLSLSQSDLHDSSNITSNNSPPKYPGNPSSSSNHSSGPIKIAHYSSAPPSHPILFHSNTYSTANRPQNMDSYLPWDSAIPNDNTLPPSRQLTRGKTFDQATYQRNNNNNLPDNQNYLLLTPDTLLDNGRQTSTSSSTCTPPDNMVGNYGLNVSINDLNDFKRGERNNTDENDGPD